MARNNGKAARTPMTLSDNPSAPRGRNGTARKAEAKPQGTGRRATLDHSFPARMPMGQFLFEYLHRRGVRHSFGVPGDFALPTFAWLDKSPIESVTMTH